MRYQLCRSEYKKMVRRLIFYNSQYKKTKNMLVEKPYIAVIGEGAYCWSNGGEMLNMTVSLNRVTALAEEMYYTYGGGNGVDKSLVGQPYGSWMGYRTDGVFHTQAEVDEYCAEYDVQFGKP